MLVVEIVLVACTRTANSVAVVVVEEEEDKEEEVER